MAYIAVGVEGMAYPIHYSYASRITLMAPEYDTPRHASLMPHMTLSFTAHTFHITLSFKSFS
jgi:hypothetical protein